MLRKSLFIFFTIFFYTAQIYGGEWTKGPRLLVPRAGASAVTYQGKIYVIGGKSNHNQILNTVEVFDPNSGQWDSSSVAPLNFARYNATATVYWNRIYVVGGRDNEDVIERCEYYDPVQNTWDKEQGLHNEREGHSAFVIGDRFFAIGGQKEEHLINKVEWYTHSDSQWQEMSAEMPFFRSAFFSVAVGNTFYMFGGYYFGGLVDDGHSAHLVENDQNKFQWDKCLSLSKPRGYGSTDVLDSVIYMIGGETQSGKTDMVEKYDLRSGQLTSGDPLPEAQSAMATAVLDSKIYVIGGYEDPSNDITRNVFIYKTDITALERQDASLPVDYFLAKTYPNPFNGRLIIGLTVNKRDKFTVNIFDINGHKIKSVYSGELNSGQKNLKWDADNENGDFVASGVYIVNIRNSETMQSKKILYVK